MMNANAGYREVEHTADWQLQVWAPDLPGLLEQAARGMYALSGTRLSPGPRQQVSLQLDARDEEGLLVSFLEEIRYLGEAQMLGFDRFELDIHEGSLSAVLVGAQILQVEKEIKAVTFHNLKIEHTSRGLHTSVVFDV